MINKIKNKIICLCKSNIFRYCVSWSFILTGIIFSFISIYLSQTQVKEIISDVIIVIGVFLNPDLNVNVLCKAIYKFFLFIGFLILSLVDLKLIKHNVLENGNVFMFIVTIILTISVITYYSFLSYCIIAKAFDNIKSNKNSISKIFKYVGVIISFLISIATLIDLIIEILNLE